MEFYVAIDFCGSVSSRFQFPTGWNSTLVVCSFLLRFMAFQFPTGWNSTQRNKKTNGNNRVLIPNGMEFYFRGLCPKKGIFGFNSQRDGILLSLVLKSSSPDICFNSQRDGILPRISNNSFLFLRVSIPNGMEFYRNLSNRHHPHQ